MWSERGPIQFFSLSQWMANGTCHMLIFSRIQKCSPSHRYCRYERQTVYFIDLLISMRRLFIISNGKKGECAHIWAAEHWTNEFTNDLQNKEFRTLLFAERKLQLIRIYSGSWRCCIEIVQTSIASTRAVVQCMTASGSELHWYANRHNQITSFSTWRRYEHSMSILVVCLSHCDSWFFVSVDLSTPHFHSNFYL